MYGTGCNIYHLEKQKINADRLIEGHSCRKFKNMEKKALFYENILGCRDYDLF